MVVQTMTDGWRRFVHVVVQKISIVVFSNLVTKAQIEKTKTPKTHKIHTTQKATRRELFWLIYSLNRPHLPLIFISIINNKYIGTSLLKDG
jgi:hypothetical protein